MTKLHILLKKWFSHLSNHLMPKLTLKLKYVISFFNLLLPKKNRKINKHSMTKLYYTGQHIMSMKKGFSNWFNLVPKLTVKIEYVTNKNCEKLTLKIIYSFYINKRRMEKLHYTLQQRKAMKKLFSHWSNLVLKLTLKIKYVISFNSLFTTKIVKKLINIVWQHSIKYCWKSDSHIFTIIWC